MLTSSGVCMPSGTAGSVVPPAAGTRSVKADIVPLTYSELDRSSAIVRMVSMVSGLVSEGELTSR